MHRAPDTFQTPRLVAERPGEEHFEAMCGLFNDPGVMEWIKLQNFSPEKTRRTMAAWQTHWEQHGFGIWVWRERDGERRVIGRGGLRLFVIDGRAEIELLYAYRQEFWGRGLGTEAARGIVAQAFGPQLALNEIAAWTLKTNRGSQRVLEKSGFVYERDILHADRPHVFYRQIRPADLDKS
ncbi:MAG: GNAT family N-acetyltransferase [Verrucomicrobia bacterium]|nr:GNAT family N-acetyltransferase [Verrucomicrobiota bacterium]